MFSLGGQLSAMSNPSLMHSFVDSFFLGKKALVKERLRQSMETVLDGLFEEMVGQVKEMLLPPLKSADSLPKPFAADAAAFSGGRQAFQFNALQQQHQQQSQQFEASFLQAKQQPPLPKSSMIFATKSKPVPSSTFVPNMKRTAFNGMDEPETLYSTYSSPAKKLKVNAESDEQEFNQEKGETGGAEGDYFIADQTDDLDDSHFIGDQPNFTSGNIVVEFDNGTTTTTTSAVSSVPVPSNKTSTTKPAPKQPAASSSSTSGKKFVCTEEDCHKSFTKGHHLRLHIRSAHSKVKPFSCSFAGCPGFSSADRSNTLRHIRTVHLKSGKRSATDEGGGGEEEDDNPFQYLTVQKELL